MSDAGTLHDRAAITDVLVRYATAIDTRDWTLFRTVFVDDCTATITGGPTTEGLERLARYMVEAHADLGSTMHRLSNITIELDGNRATTRTYLDAILLASDGATGLQLLGHYDDELTRTEDGWRIAHRTFTKIHAHPLGAA